MMAAKVFVKRILPFVATFAIGIFIASFFVDVTMSRFRGRGFSKRHQEIKRLRVENEDLKNDNLRLRNEGGEHSKCLKSINLESGEEVYSLMPLEMPPPPMPVAPRSRR